MSNSARIYEGKKLLEDINDILRCERSALNVEQKNHIDRSMLQDIIEDDLIISDSKNLRLCQGISNGCVCGGIVNTNEDIKAVKRKGYGALIVCDDARFINIDEFTDYDGIILLEGSLYSHISIVARSKGIPAILLTGKDKKEFLTKLNKDKEGKYNLQVSIDGTRGILFYGICGINEHNSKCRQKMQKWCNDVEQYFQSYDIEYLHIYGNADSETEAVRSLEKGAKGIGACRIEHMFIQGYTLKVIQNLLLSNEFEKYKRIHKELIEERVKNILDIVTPMPFTIRLMDLLPSEILPRTEDEIRRFSVENKLCIDTVRENIEEYHKIGGSNGLRGCRYGLTHKDVYIAQVEAILSAAQKVAESGKIVDLNIIIPFVRDAKEVEEIYSIIKASQKEFNFCGSSKVNVKIGAMIEIPSAAFQADKLAKYCDVLVFGTNDLTQFTHALSRDMFIEEYRNLFNNPYNDIDEQAVGKLIEIAFHKSKSVNQNIIYAICGEHANYLSTIQFFSKMGGSFISCVANNILPVKIMSYKNTLHNVLNQSEDNNMLIS